MIRQIKKYLLTGMLVWIPIAVTLWVIQFLLHTLDGIAAWLPSTYRPDQILLDRLTQFVPELNWLHALPGWGLLMTLLVFLITGILTTNMLGRRVLASWEHILNRIPIIRGIYGSVKQVSDTVFSDNGKAFNKALLVQFPHAGTWTVAFQTGTPSDRVASYLNGEHISVYVPTTPNPTSGYFLLVKRSDIIELTMSVDEALKYVISMGVVTPA